MLIQLVNILGPIILITAIGYLLGKSSVALQSRTLSSLVILIATPALVFNTLTSMGVDLSTIGLMAAAALFCIVLAGILAGSGLSLVGGSHRTYLPSLILPNSGNMGLPLVVLAFGPEGMRLGISFFFTVALFQYSVGLSIVSGSFRLGDLARQPLIYSVALVLLVTSLNIPVPTVIQTTAEMLGGMMIPSMLILLGTSLATLKVTDLRPAFYAAVARLIVGVLAAVSAIFLFGFSGVAAGTVFLMGTMPSAIVTYVFAERYQQSATKVAGTVVMSTLLTFAFLPALVWIALWISGLPGEVSP